MRQRPHLYQNGDYWVAPDWHGFSVYQTHPLGAQRCSVITLLGDLGLSRARAECDRLAAKYSQLVKDNHDSH